MITALRRCWPFFQANLQVVATYRANFLMMAAAGLIAIAIKTSLWHAVFAASLSPVLGGFTLDEITAYVVIASLIGLLLNHRVEHDVAADIMRGDIVAAMVRPVDYQAQKFFTCLPVIFANLIFVGGPIGAFMVLPFDLALPSANNVPPFLVSVVLSIGIAFAIDFIIGCVAFWTINIWGVQTCKAALAFLFSGQAIPLSFFDGLLAALAWVLPFRGLIHTPVCILLGKYDGAPELASLLAQQCGWLVCLLLLSRVVWRAASIRIEVQGG